jgi:hypothetical protein
MAYFVLMFLLSLAKEMVCHRLKYSYSSMSRQKDASGKKCRL